jgi:arginine utilization protein RocB
MPPQHTEHNTWHQIVHDYTQRLVAIRSVSPGRDEVQVAHEILRMLHEDGLATRYTASGLDAIEGDLYGRQNAYAFLRGQSATTLVLLGHFDTVDTADYGPLEPWAIDPPGLAARLDTLTGSDSREDTSDWMFGRGVADMKSGVAINIALMRRLAREERFPLSVVLLATPDEENESAGVLQGVQLLLRLREQYGLHYIGAINTDYTTATYPGDRQRYIYTGTVGKLLPSFLCIGRESHAGAPFQGLDANLLAAELIRDLSMNDELCDTVRGQITAPPVTLHASDLKDHYDVQLPFAASFYLNVLTFTTDPAMLLERLRAHAENVLARLLQRIDETEWRWLQAGDEQGQRERPQPRSGTVLTYADLYAEMVHKYGEHYVNSALMVEWGPITLDKRERSLHLVRRLWSLSGRQGPAIVIAYAPPYYPHVSATPGALHEAVKSIVQAHPEHPLVVREYFPLLSDMSYLRLEAGLDLSALKANMPLWRDFGPDFLPGAYTLPLAAIEQLDLPIVNWGPYGRGAHQRHESVLMSYSFGTLPQLLYETLQQLALTSR